MRWVVRVLAAAAVLAAGMGHAQPQAPRLALVIGNAAYTTPGWALVNPVNDATLIGTRLRALGFAVTPLNNGTKAQMEAAMASFVARLKASGEDAVGVFYYAGHAAEHDGANLLVPVDVSARSMDELRYQAPPLNFVLRDMARAGNKVNIVILDACRNLPLPAGTRDGAAGGLSALDDVPTNVLLAYATRAGATAPDNPGERNSVFTRTLAGALASNASDPLEVFFANVQSSVAAATGFQQRPEFRSQLLRAPGFRLAAATASASGSAPAPVVRPDPEVERQLREARDRIAALEEERAKKMAPTSAPPRSPAVSDPTASIPNWRAALTRNCVGATGPNYIGENGPSFSTQYATRTGILIDITSTGELTYHYRKASTRNEWRPREESESIGLSSPLLRVRAEPRGILIYDFLVTTGQPPVSISIYLSCRDPVAASDLIQQMNRTFSSRR